MRKPRALRPGDRIAVVAPASPFAARRVRRRRRRAAARSASSRSTTSASSTRRATWPATRRDARGRVPAGLERSRRSPRSIAVRGGYGSVQLLPLLDPCEIRRTPKAFIGYSDNTSLLSWLTLTCGIVSFHGPMLEGRLASGEAGYDRDTFARCLTRAEPVGEIIASADRDVLQPGEARGHAGRRHADAARRRRSARRTRSIRRRAASCSSTKSRERPYRIDRMLTQLRLSGPPRARVGGRLRRAAAVRRAGRDGPAAGGRRRAARRLPRARALRPAVGAHERRDADAAVRRPGARRHRRRVPRSIIEEAAVEDGTRSSVKRIHLIGICGTAMATLAALLKSKGYDVRGSDQNVYPPMSDFLARAGHHDAPGLQRRAHHAPISTSSSSATPSRAATPSSRRCSIARSATARCPRRSAITFSGARGRSSSPARTARRRRRR